jgi:hemolysin III
MLEKVTLPSYTKGEEIFNGISHGVGILFAIFATVFYCFQTEESYKLAGALVFTLSAMFLYLSSTLYHALTKENIKKIFRLIDHSVIFIMITGTVMALNLITIYPVNKTLSIFGTVASIIVTIVGIALTFFDQERFKNVQLVLYVAISCIPLCGAKTLFDTNESALPITILLASGGIIYGIGMALYIIGKKKKKKYFHSVFHLFVLAGTLIHFFAINIAI